MNAQKFMSTQVFPVDKNTWVRYVELMEEYAKIKVNEYQAKLEETVRMKVNYDLKRREYRPQVLNVKYWKIEEYREGKLFQQFGCFTTKKQVDEVIENLYQVIQAFIEDNGL